MERIIDVSMTQKRTRRISDAVQQFGGKLFGFIRKKVNSNEEAEDVIQDVWFQLSNLGTLADLENVGSWLYRVATNKVTDLYRKKKPDSLEALTFETEDGELDLGEILLFDDSSNPELGLFKKLFWEELMDTLDELPDKQREVFILHEIEDLSLKEIAQQTGENIKTVISRKGYAVKHLRNKLEYLYQELID